MLSQQITSDKAFVLVSEGRYASVSKYPHISMDDTHTIYPWRFEKTTNNKFSTTTNFPVHLRILMDLPLRAPASESERVSSRAVMCDDEHGGLVMSFSMDESVPLFEATFDVMRNKFQFRVVSSKHPINVGKYLSISQEERLSLEGQPRDWTVVRLPSQLFVQGIVSKSRW